MSPSDFFEVAVFLLSSLVSGLSFMLMSLSVLVLQQSSLTKDWPEIQKLEIPVWVLLKIRRLGQVRDTKFDINISNEMLQNASKCYGHSLFLLFLNYLRRTNRGGGVKSPPPDRHTHRVKLAIRVCLQCHFIYLHISSKQLWYSQQEHMSNIIDNGYFLGFNDLLGCCLETFLFLIRERWILLKLLKQNLVMSLLASNWMAESFEVMDYGDVWLKWLNYIGVTLQPLCMKCKLIIRVPFQW